jgi:general secretion pathway protein F
MAVFFYEAVRKDGGVERGRLESPSVSAAAQAIAAAGKTPVSVELDDRSASARRSMWIAESGQRARDLRRLLEQVAALLNAGLAIAPALAAMRRSSGTAEFAALIDQLLESVRQGQSFSAAMAAIPGLTPLYVAQALAAAERAGALPQAVAAAAETMKRADAIRQRLITALLYPAIVALLMVIVLGIVLLGVAPQVKVLFAENEGAMPFATRIVTGLSDLLVNQAWLLVAVMAGAVITALTWLRSPSGAETMEKWILSRWFLFGVVRNWETARALRAAALSLDGGARLPDALIAAAQGASAQLLRGEWQAMARSIAEGSGLREAFEAHGRFEPRVTELAGAGDSAGKVAPMLRAAAAILEEESEAAMDRFLSILPVAVTIVLGVLIGAVFLGVVEGVAAANELLTR